MSTQENRIDIATRLRQRERFIVGRERPRTYESGNVDQHARNDGDEAVPLFNSQILPVGWQGSSAITVTAVPD